MRLLFLVLLSLAACEACGPKAPKPKAEHSSSKCRELKCNAVGACECK